MPNPENLQLLSILVLSLNLKQITAFAFQEYQRLGRGFVVVDQMRPYAIYAPQVCDCERSDDDPHFIAVLEQVSRYDPARSFCLYFGTLSGVLAETLGLAEDLPERVPMAGWLMPAIAPQDCSLELALVTRVEGEGEGATDLNVLRLQVPETVRV